MMMSESRMKTMDRVRDELVKTRNRYELGRLCDRAFYEGYLQTLRWVLYESNKMTRSLQCVLAEKSYTIQTKDLISSFRNAYRFLKENNLKKSSSLPDLPVPSVKLEYYKGCYKALDWVLARDDDGKPKMSDFPRRKISLLSDRGSSLRGR
jgi:hypothetical protein